LQLADTYASLVDWFVREHDKHVALICMEQLDEPLAREILKRLEYPERTKVFSSRKYNASQMTVLLRALDLLITSRFHASVLSLEAAIPQIAVGHDLRLKTLYTDLGLLEKYFFQSESTDLLLALKDRSSQLLTNPHTVRDLLKRGYAEHSNRARSNRKILSEFLHAHGFDVVDFHE
jgi:polysaccharide pyruvyl transferase WcaK-like protein